MKPENFPFLIIDNYVSEFRKELRVTISCGIIQKDQEKGLEEIMSFKEIIKKALKRNATLDGSVSYVTMLASRKTPNMAPPFHGRTMIIYISQK